MHSKDLNYLRLESHRRFMEKTEIEQVLKAD